MPEIGPLEILVVAVVALIVFGPTRLPDMARQVGRAMAELRRQANDLRSEFETSMKVEDEKPAPPIADGSTTPKASTAPDSATAEAPPIAEGLAPQMPHVHKGTTTELGYRTSPPTPSEEAAAKPDDERA
jgi:Tat protein translocase TatB subunit